MAPKRKQEPKDEPKEEKSNKKGKSDGSGAKVNPKRWRELKEGAVKEGPVIYWQVVVAYRCHACISRAQLSAACRMSRDQRVNDNWAFIHACEQAAKTGSPVAVAFNLVRS